MALRAGYYGVKRRIWEALQKTVSDDTQNIVDIKAGQALLGSVNILDITATTTTTNNVTFTVNADKSVSVVTTAAGASSTTFFPLESYKTRTGQTIYVKGCPAGGGMTNYCLQIRAQDQSSVGIEDGTGKWFTFDSDDSALYALGIRINTGAKITTPIKFYPVLTLTDLDYPFASFAMTNQQLTNEVSIDTFEDNDTGIKAVRFGHVVTVSFESASAITAEANTVFCTLPAGFRPSLSSISFCEPIAQKRICIGNTGGIFCSSSLTAATVRGCITFVTSTAISLSRSLDAAPEERSLDVEVEEPVVVKKTTRKKTTKTEEEE